MTTITVPRALIERALEALELCAPHEPGALEDVTLHDLRAALAAAPTPKPTLAEQVQAATDDRLALFYAVAAAPTPPDVPATGFGDTPPASEPVTPQQSLRVLAECVLGQGAFVVSPSMPSAGLVVVAPAPAPAQTASEPVAWMLTGGTDIYPASDFAPDGEHRDEWTPLYAHPAPAQQEDAIRAAVLAERERSAVAAWNHYMDICRKQGHGPDVCPEWNAAAAIRKGEPT